MATTTKVKTAKVLCDPAVFISIGRHTIPVGQLTLAQAELVARQHPGRYVAIIEKRVISPAADAPTKA